MRERLLRFSRYEVGRDPWSNEYVFDSGYGAVRAPPVPLQRPVLGV